MVRAAAKNYGGCAVVTDPADYAALLEEMRGNDGALVGSHAFRPGAESLHPHRPLRRRDRQLPDRAQRRRHAQRLPAAPATRLRPRRGPALRRESAPAGGVLPRPGSGHRRHRQLPPAAGQGTFLQQHRRRRCRLGMRQDLRLHQPACCVIVKHANPCGVALGASAADAYRKASRPTRPRPSAASSLSTARSTRRRPRPSRSSSSKC